MNNQIVNSFINQIQVTYKNLVKITVAEAHRLKRTDEFDLFDEFKKVNFRKLNKLVRDSLGRTKLANDILEKYNDEYVKLTNNLDLVVSKRGIKTFNIDGARVVIFGLLDEQAYVNLIKETTRKLKLHGLMSVWYGEIYIISESVRKKISPEESLLYKELGLNIPAGMPADGEYDHDTDTVIITGGFSKPRYELENLLHELGHRFYYKILKKQLRMRWKDYLKTDIESYDQPNLPNKKMSTGEKSPIKPVSKYGASNADEAFAEAFFMYCLDKKMSPEQLNFFEKTIKNVLAENLIKNLIKELLR